MSRKVRAVVRLSGVRRVRREGESQRFRQVWLNVLREQGYISLFLRLRLYGSEKVFFSSPLLSFEDDNSGITPAVGLLR